MMKNKGYFFMSYLGRLLALSLLSLPLCLKAQDSTKIMLEKDSIYSEKILSLSLSDAIRFAVSKNPSLKIAGMEIQKSTHAERLSYSALFPQINFQGTYSYTLKKQKMYFDMGKGSMMGGSSFAKDGFEVGQNHNLQGALHVSMPLVAPSLWTSLAIGKEQVMLAKEKARSSEIDLVLEVRKAYFAALLAQASKEVFQRTFDQAKANYELIEQKYKRGVVAEYDVVRMKVQMENIRPNLMQAQEAFSLAKNQLRVLLDMKPSQEFTLQGSLASYADQLLQWKSEIEAEDTLRIEGNSSLRQMKIQQKQLQHSEKIKRMAFLPTLAMNYLYQHSFMSDEFKLSNKKRWSPYSMIGLSLNIPLFTGGKNYYEHKNAKLAVIEMDLQKYQMERQLQTALLSLESQIRKAITRFEASKASVESAEKGMKIAEKRYMTGQGTLLEMNDADVSRLQAWLNFSQSIYDGMIAIFSIEQLEGVDVGKLNLK